MRFLVDASMSPVVVQELREAGHDAVHVGESLRLDAPDTETLEHAARHGRVIVAADTDFGDLLAPRGGSRAVGRPDRPDPRQP
jgi:predicted nuclease of predicted toxin-antitoxin system